MKNIARNLTTLWRFASVAALLLAAAQWTTVSAQNPGAVFVEGNCTGAQTMAAPIQSCGDYDGDGRIGADENTDGDNVYGTIQFALNAIAHNGKVVIVTSGIFTENVYIGQLAGSDGAADPGNVTLEAAPGVEAVIDAFAQPPSTAVAGNGARAAGTGIAVNYTTNGANRRVTLRNLQVRNFNLGVTADNNTRINIDNLRVENNVNVGIRISNNAWAEIVRTHVTATCFRIGPPVAPPCTVGHGIFANGPASVVSVSDSVSSHNGGYGIFAGSGGMASAMKVTTHYNNNSLTPALQNFGLKPGSVVFDF